MAVKSKPRTEDECFNETITLMVSNWLKRQTGRTFCDDCIAAKLALSRRQQGFRVTGALGTMQEFKRSSGICCECGKEKLVTGAC